MPESFSPEQVSSKTFGRSLMGYHPGEVSLFLHKLAAGLRGLQEERERLRMRLGDDAVRDLSAEFQSVSLEVGRVLESARVAAEGMRERSAADSARWRAETLAETEGERRRARADAEHLRSDAWSAAEELLKQVQLEVQTTSQTAQSEFLNIRGEAERQAKRLISDATSESEEMVRLARMEAEKLRLEAQSQHDELIAGARREVDAAQERARALEQRRDELMEELTAVRTALSRFEGELEARQQVADRFSQPGPSATVKVVQETTIPTEPPTPTTEPSPTTTEPSADQDWQPGGTVRVIPPEDSNENNWTATPFDRRPDPAEQAQQLQEQLLGTSVDPASRSTETVAAGVTDGVSTTDSDRPEQPRAVGSAKTSTGKSSFAAPQTMSSEVETNRNNGEPESGSEDVADQDEVKVIGSKRSSSPRGTRVEPVEGIDQDSKNGPKPVLPAADPTSTVVGSTKTQTSPADPGSVPDQIDQLFSDLRSERTENGSKLNQPGAKTPGENSRSISTDSVESGSDNEEDSDDVNLGSTASEPADIDAIAQQVLIPLTNRVLKTVKRRLSEAQNLLLEQIRVTDADGGYEELVCPDSVERDLETLALESFASGHAVSQQHQGIEVSLPTFSGIDATADFPADLASQICAVVNNGRNGSLSARAINSAVSKVYRSWRAEETERRIFEIAKCSFQLGWDTVSAETTVPAHSSD